MTIEQKISELLSESEKLAQLESQNIAEDFTDMTLEELEDFMEGFMQSEEYEQLDELSKSTLASYVGKAARSASYHRGGSAVMRRLGRKQEADADYMKSVKRLQGVEKAAGRLAREDFSYDASEDVNALVSGEELTEEFKAKAATIFEAAVVTRVKEELAKLEEEFDARLDEQVEVVKEGLVEKVDGYLNYVVEQWMTDNELALESGVKNEILESFVSGLKNVFEQHYIEVPEEKYDVIGELSETVEQVSAKLDEQLAVNVQLTKQINEMKRASAIKEASEGMTDIECEKFSALAEELSYEDADTFKTKLQTIKENYFGKKASAPVVTSVVTDAPVELKEEAKIENIDPRMAGYLRALGK